MWSQRSDEGPPPSKRLRCDAKVTEQLRQLTPSTPSEDSHLADAIIRSLWRCVLLGPIFIHSFIQRLVID